jgi:hypothetical protein
MILNRSDIVQIPFPFSNLKSSKRRPVLLLTELDALGDFLAVAITSQPWHRDAISLQNDDLINGILPKETLIKSICHSDHREESFQLIEWIALGTSKISRCTRNDNLISASLNKAGFEELSFFH